MRTSALPFALVILAIASCSKPRNAEPTVADPERSAPPAASPNTTRLDVCALLTKEEVASVQGEPFSTTQAMNQNEGGLAISLCGFAISPQPGTITLRVVRSGSGPGAREVRQVWNDAFDPDKLSAVHGGREKVEPPEKISGLGDEAYWRGVGESGAGALYVLKGDTYIVVSLSGREDKERKLEKSSKLAALVLERL